MGMDPGAEFEAHRSRLFGLAYRLLGSATEAEDTVQEAYLRWAGAAHAEIISVPAWLTTVVTNLCLTHLTSARARREHYVGPWLPEPVLTGDGALGPLETAEQRESVSLALLVLLERLGPAERAVFVLREAFDYDHRAVAAAIGLTETNCRQLHRRARQRLGDGDARTAPVDPTLWRGFVKRFLAAAHGGDIAGLEQLLTADVTAIADGGGKVTAARRPVLGRANVARYVVGGMANVGADFDITLAEVNGQPAILGWQGTRLAGTLVLELDGEQISAMRIVANPDKLRFAAAQGAGLSHLAGPLSLHG